MAVPQGHGEAGHRKRSHAQSTPSGLWAGMEAGGGGSPLHALAGGLPLPMLAVMAGVGTCLAFEAGWVCLIVCRLRFYLV